MSKSPLSSSFESAESKKSSKKGWLGLGAVAFFGLASAGSVFAASVQIGGASDSISFTQGVETIAACDSAISASLDSEYDGTNFGLSGITLTGVDAGCSSEPIALNLYDGTTKMLTVTATLGASLSNSTVSVSAGDTGDDDNFIEAETSVAFGSSDNDWQNVSGNVVVTFDSGTAITMAANADKLVIEIG